MSTQNTHTKDVDALTVDLADYLTDAARSDIDTSYSYMDVDLGNMGIELSADSRYGSEVTVSIEADEHEIANELSAVLDERVSDFSFSADDIHEALDANGLKLVPKGAATADDLSPIKVIDDLITAHEAAKENTHRETVAHMQDQLRIITRIDMLKQVRQTFEANGIQ